MDVSSHGPTEISKSPPALIKKTTFGLAMTIAVVV